MKYQNFAIIFVLILLPISIVLSYYIQSQTDTLTLQTSYQTKLNDSTYDAITAYQMNSLNTERVTGESVKSYVLASVNTFFTTLATNLGMSNASKSRLQSYVPAILFTTYDGYYIYSPTKTSQIAENPNDGIGLLTKENDLVYIDKNAPAEYRPTDTDVTEIGKNNLGNKFTTNEDNAKLEYNYMLKPFIYYSAQYKKGNDFDFVASYTLDNYMTVYGTKQKTNGRDTGNHVTNEFSKSGYLIDPAKIKLNGQILVKTVTRNSNNNNQSSVEPTADGKSVYEATIDANKNSSSTAHNTVRYQPIDINSQDAYNYINYFNYAETGTSYSRNGIQYYPSRKNSNSEIRYQTGDEIVEASLDIEELWKAGLSSDIHNYLVMNGGFSGDIKVVYDGVQIIDREAKEYYIKSYFFSKWVQNNLKDIEAKSIDQSQYPVTNFEYTDFSDDSTKIFDISSNNNPELESSEFVQHKRNVIKNSIQFNLNTAISTYNTTYYSSNFEYLLPIMKADDWDNILNNVTMVSFMQGIPCGTTMFNNYAVVKSNNNNTSVSLENLYFTDNIGRNSRGNNYHKYDCPDLGNSGAGAYESDLSAEFKYDAKKINTKVKDSSSTDIICFYDDSTNTYYEVNVSR